MKTTHIFSTIVAATIVLSESALGLKLLHFVPGFSRSHYLFNNRLACSLKQAGHDVVIVNNRYLNYIGENVSPCNITQIQLKNTLLEPEDEAEMMMMQNDYAFQTSRVGGIQKLMSLFHQLFTNTCRVMEQSHDVMDQLQQYKFDASLSQVFGYCNIAVSEQLNLPVIFVSGGNYILDHVADMMGLPFPSSFVPSPISSFSDKMTFKERLQNLFMHFMNNIILRIPIPSLAVNFEERKFFQTDPQDESLKTLLEYGSALPIMLLNGEEIVDLPRPVSTGVHYNGELNPISMQQTQTAKQMENRWTEIINDPTKKGVILFSFGTVANTENMPSAMKDTIIEALKKFADYNIIWKVNKVFSIAEAGHIYVVEWVPQRALLNHDRLKLFITHGGYNSLLETCQAGVPVVTIPLFADQFGNALRAERLGFSRTIRKDDLTAEKLSSAVQVLLEDSSYAKNAQKVAAMMGDRIRPNIDLVSHQVERAVRHHDTLPRLIVTRQLNWFQYYSFDVILAVILLLWVVLRFFAGITRRLILKFNIKLNTN